MYCMLINFLLVGYSVSVSAKVEPEVASDSTELYCGEGPDNECFNDGKCNCSGHSKCNPDGTCIKCENFTTGKNCERCQVKISFFERRLREEFSIFLKENYYGIALNNGTCTKCQCGRHGKSCDHKTGKCSCTTKGVTGDQCNMVSLNIFV